MKKEEKEFKEFREDLMWIARMPRGSEVLRVYNKWKGKLFKDEKLRKEVENG